MYNLAQILVRYRVPYRTAPHRTTPHRTAPHRTASHLYTVQYRYTVLYLTVPRHTLSYRAVWIIRSYSKYSCDRLLTGRTTGLLLLL